ncbi:hypothetical protein [Psychrobacillus lasiicapitis]|uniref:Uncharacterized protein n=1 Tax=Psychrobacillus lasiicapitis TaxID=1636719 RepID=A0A544T325_9BACI|nr:hypothetical protein [Psychrobacillus lasiicapitis]TQR11857.1 hypothetical protein FG382_14695 [Psychrobacillus lasiicapitis]GGA20003.1 hypothetical protein GCM10011384_06700 [Psychrobacillus lasiicapitis]
MHIEETILTKRSLSGYSSRSIVKHIQSLQEKYRKEIGELKEKLLVEKEMNQKLKVEIELNQSIPSKNKIEEQIKLMLEDVFQQHMVHTRAILDYQTELKEQQLNYLQELESKKQQKILAKERLQEALHYFKILPGVQIELKKVKIE